MSQYLHFYTQPITTHWEFWLFMLAVTADIALGSLQAISSRTFTSQKMKNGLITHLFLVVIFSLVYPFVAVKGFEFIAGALITLLTASYVISILENLIQLGAPIPAQWLSIAENIQSQDAQAVSKLESDTPALSDVAVSVSSSLSSSESAVPQTSESANLVTFRNAQ